MAASTAHHTALEDTNVESKPHRRGHAQQHVPPPSDPPARHRPAPLKAKASDRGLAWYMLPTCMSCSPNHQHTQERSTTPNKPTLLLCGTSSSRHPSPYLTPHITPQVLCAAAWAACCTIITLEALKTMNTAHTELFALYYTPLLPILLLAWLWALSVGYFERHGVQYALCFSRTDQAALPSSRQLASLAAAATLWTLTSSAVFTYQCVAGAMQWAAVQPWLLYGGLLVMIVAPVDVLGMVRWVGMRSNAMVLFLGVCVCVSLQPCNLHSVRGCSLLKPLLGRWCPYVQCRGLIFFLPT